MKWKTFVIGYVLALAILLFAQRHTAPAQGSGFTAVLDLSHVVSSNAPAYELRERSVIHAKTAATLEKLGYSAREMSLPERSEERRVGKECRSRWSPYH